MAIGGVANRLTVNGTTYVQYHERDKSLWWREGGKTGDGNAWDTDELADIRRERDQMIKDLKGYERDIEEKNDEIRTLERLKGAASNYGKGN